MVILLLLIAAALAGLRFVGVRGGLLQISAAAMLFGAAGYALQGRPGLPSARAEVTQQAAPIPLTTLRQAFFGQFSGSERWLRIAEGYASRGNTEDAIKAVRRGIDFRPGDIQLWIALGNALVDHSRALTPAAEFAFRRAADLAPGHPAPRFFFGLALARSGQPELAVGLWRDVLAEAPADASWRPYVENALAALSPAARGNPDASSQTEAEPARD